LCFFCEWKWENKISALDHFCATLDHHCSHPIFLKRAGFYFFLVQGSSGGGGQSLTSGFLGWGTHVSEQGWLVGKAVAELQ
nr:hypothetical protein [Tanacetum cinerariifolium]